MSRSSPACVRARPQRSTLEMRKKRWQERRWSDKKKKKKKLKILHAFLGRGFQLLCMKQWILPPLWGQMLWGNSRRSLSHFAGSMFADTQPEFPRKLQSQQQTSRLCLSHTIAHTFFFFFKRTTKSRSQIFLLWKCITFLGGNDKLQKKGENKNKKHVKQQDLLTTDSLCSVHF